MFGPKIKTQTRVWPGKGEAILVHIGLMVVYHISSLLSVFIFLHKHTHQHLLVPCLASNLRQCWRLDYIALWNEPTTLSRDSNELPCQRTVFNHPITRRHYVPTIIHQLPEVPSGKGDNSHFLNSQLSFRPLNKKWSKELTWKDVLHGSIWRGVFTSCPEVKVEFKQTRNFTECM